MSPRAAAAEPSWPSLLAPLDVEIVAPAAPVRSAGDPAAILGRALRRAGVARFLEAAAGEGAGLTVVVNDPHRDTGTRAALAAMFTEAGGGAGLPLSLLVACGSHAFDPVARRRHEEAILGPFRDRFAVIAWHDARDAGALAPAGRFRLHRLVAAARSVLGIGSLEPHYFAGCTGAHKTLTIGVMGLADIEANHRGALSECAAPLALHANPVVDGVREALAALRGRGTRLFALNEIRSGGRIVGATAGDPLQALSEGLPQVRRIAARTIAAPADLIVARVRPPLDRSLYQADKGIKNVEAAVRDGGVLLLDAPCVEGIGIDRFVRLLERAPDHAAAAALIETEGYVLGDHKALRLRRLTGPRGVRLGIVSRSLEVEAGRVLQAAILSGRPAAAAWARQRLAAGGRPSGRACIVEDAGNVTLSVAPPVEPAGTARGIAG